MLCDLGAKHINDQLKNVRWFKTFLMKYYFRKKKITFWSEVKISVQFFVVLSFCSVSTRKKKIHNFHWLLMVDVAFHCLTKLGDKHQLSFFCSSVFMCLRKVLRFVIVGRMTMDQRLAMHKTFKNREKSIQFFFLRFLE